MNEKEKLRELIGIQIEVQCALNRELGNNIVKLAKLEKIDAVLG